MQSSATSAQSCASSTPPLGMEGDISSMARVRGPMAARSASRSRRQAAAGREDERHLARHAAGQPHPVQKPRIGRVGDDDLVADFDRRQQGIEDAGQAAGGDDAVAARV